MKINSHPIAVLVVISIALSFMFTADARDTVEDEFNAIENFISNPPSSSWMQYAYSQDSMPLAGERDPVDVLLRRTRALLNEFNTNGQLDSLDASLNALELENNNVPIANRSARLVLFRQVSEISRQVAFANPLLNFNDIVFLKRKFAKYTHMVDQYLGFHGVAGGGIYILENAFSDNPTLRDVLENSVVENGRFKDQQLNFGSFLNPTLSYDGKTIFFSHTETGGTNYTWTENTCYHIFRVNVDGTDLRQLTDGPVNDLFPFQMPNGRIVFCSDRRGGYVRCGERKCPTYAMYTANADGTDITQFSGHETNEWHPSVDNDGMVIYTRWDYVDRGDDQAHHPWICYPDGRDPRAIHGNWKEHRTDSPYMEQHVRAIPNSHKYVATASPHHGQTFGSFVLIDPRVEDDNKMSPLKVLTPDALFPEALTGSTTDWKYATAWALNERFYLCGYDPYGNGTGSIHALTLLDAKTGLKTTIYHDPDIPCYHPTPLIPRNKAPLIPHRVASGLPLEPGVVFDPNVYDQMPTTAKVALMNVYDSTLPFPEGTEIAELRIYEILSKTTYHHYDPHIGYALEDPARRVLGTVPVETDGSAFFTVPADTPIYFQALDANGMAVQSMRSLTYAKPGETLTCAGCHELQGSAPLMDVPASALKRAPSDITPEPDGSNPFNFPRLVQPVFDDKCVACHQSNGAMDLSAGNYQNNDNYWYNSYINLLDFAFFYGASVYDGIAYDTWNPTTISTPGQVGARASRLYQEILSQNHHGLTLTDEEMRRITLWLDSNSDFFGAYENSLTQAQGGIVQPLDPRVSGYQTVVDTVYGPAIPAEPDPNLSNNDGLSRYGSPLELRAPLIGGEPNRPVTLGQQIDLQVYISQAGQDIFSYVNSSIILDGMAFIDGQPVDQGTVLAQWSQLTGPIDAVFGNSNAFSTSVQFPQPGSYILQFSVESDMTVLSDEVLVTVLLANTEPLVDAGSDKVVSANEPNIVLTGFVDDDSTLVTSNWSQISGPATVIFDNPAEPACTVTFPSTGNYELRLTADDGEYQVFDECTVQVREESYNNPPSVSCGNDITISYSNNPLTLNGSASDDGLPQTLEVTWSVISGPGTVTFGDSSSPITTADFSIQGYYLLQLTAYDGQRTAYDQLSVYLNDSNGSPGPFRYVKLVALSEVNGHPWTSTAEFNVLDENENYINRSGWTVTADSEETVGSDTLAIYVLDGDPDTIWHTEWYFTDPPHPHEIQIDFGQDELISAFVYLPRQNMANGRIANYEFYGSNDGTNWSLLADGTFPNTTAEQTVTVSFTPPASIGPVVLPLNEKPGVLAGPDLNIDLDEQATLRGIATDHNSLTVQWQKAGGPGDVNFADASSMVTTATFSSVGRYLLRLDANDGELSNSDTTLVTVTDANEYDYFYTSPQETAWSTNGSFLAVADTGLNRVAIIDTATKSLITTVAVEGTPRGITWESDNLFWVCEYDAGTLALVDVSFGDVVYRTKVGPKPYDVKYDFSRDRLIVTDYGLSKVHIVDAVSGAAVTEVPVVMKPMYMALSPTESFVLVANSEPEGDARELDHGCVVSRIDLTTFNETQINLPYGSTSLRGIVVSPDGNWGYVTHLLGRTHLPTTQLNDGWVFNNVISIIDLNSNEVYATILLDALEEGAANPWGLSLSDDGNELWVCGSGVHELIGLDMTQIHAYLASDPQVRDFIDYDMIMLYENGWIHRYPLSSDGPRGVATSPDGNTLAVANYFGGEVHLFDLASNEIISKIATGPSVPEHALRRGERLYFDGNGCFQRWLSCSSCHPGARSDGLNWDLLNDGIGNPKNSLSHLHSTKTAPSMSTGVRASVAVAIQAGFKYIQFQQRSVQEMQDVYDYLDSIKPEPSPHLNKKWMTAEALCGKAIFNDPAVGCATCHSGDYFTNLQQYDVGTGHPDDIGPYDPIYDTPILHELWRSPSYLHDGSAPTLSDVLTTENPGDQHGATSHLSSTQIDDLIAYLNQIAGIDDWINQMPIVDAGTDLKIVLPANNVNMDAFASDEGLPYSVLNGNWTLVSGPDNVVFDDPNDPSTEITFTTAGQYQFEFEVDDGDITNTDTVTVRVYIYAGDLTFDGIVNMVDLAELGQGWLTIYEMDSLQSLADDWLLGTY